MKSTERAEREKILQKIRNLKEQADSTEFEEEADTCWRIIGQIIAKYQIEEEEIEDIPEDKGRMDMEEIAGLTNVMTSYTRWESVLASAVANVFDCDTIRKRYKRPWVTVFIGRRRDINMAIHFFDYLRREVRRSAKRKWRGDSKNQGVYAMSMTNTLCRRLREAYKAKEMIDTETTAIVHMRRKEAEQFKVDQFPNLKISHPRGISGDREAVLQGREDGKHVPLSNPISGTGTQRRTIK